MPSRTLRGVPDSAWPRTRSTRSPRAATQPRSTRCAPTWLHRMRRPRPSHHLPSTAPRTGKAAERRRRHAPSGGSRARTERQRPRGLVAATHGCRRPAGAREADVPLARPLLDEPAEGEARRLMHGAVPDVVRRGGGSVRRCSSARCARDPAMLVWLDGRENTECGTEREFRARVVRALHARPRNPLARRHTATQPYTSTTCRSGPRADGLVDRPEHLQGVLASDAATMPGPRRCSATPGALGLDDVVAIAVGNDACAPHVVARLWSRIGRPAAADDAVVQELAAPFARDLDIAALLRAMFLHPEFRTAETRTRAGEDTGRVRRRHRSGPCASTPAVPGLRAVVGLDQIPFVPPDVAGWPANAAWLSTSSAQVRLQFAIAVAEPRPTRADHRARGPRPPGRGGRAPARCRRVERHDQRRRSRRSPPSRRRSSPSRSSRPSTCRPRRQRMSPISRRQFLSGAAVLGGAAAVGGWGCWTRPATTRWGHEHERISGPTSARAPGAAGTLVLVTLYGGNDALNTVVPIGDARYAAQRGDLAFDPARVHTLSTASRSIPRSPGARRCGTTIAWRSCTASASRISTAATSTAWTCGRPDRRTTTRPVGSAAGSTRTAPTRSPRSASAGRCRCSCAAPDRSAAVVPAGAFELPGDARIRDQLAALTQPDDDRSPLAAMVASSTADLLSVVDTVGPVLASGAARRRARRRTALRPTGSRRDDDRSRSPDARVRRRPRQLRHPCEPGRDA